MVDVMSPEARSRTMAAIRGRDTKPELRLRRALHARGLRYRLHGSDLPGRPDIILPRHRAVIFVHGCFWHRHEGCSKATMPTTRAEFWRMKFEANMARDRRQVAALRMEGWRVGLVWECRIGRVVDAPLLEAVEAFVRGDETMAEWH